MKILSGQSWENGIGFNFKYKNKKFFISAKNKKDANDNKKIFFDELFVLIIYFIICIVLDRFCGISTLFGGVCVLIFTTCSFVIWNKRNASKKTFKYHAVEHKIINYYSNYGELPTKEEEIENEDSISNYCGTTIITSLTIFISAFLITYAIVLNPFALILINICIFGLTVYLWLRGKLNFFQKLTLAEPDKEEIELGIALTKRLLKYCEQIDNNQQKN